MDSNWGVFERAFIRLFPLLVAVFLSACENVETKIDSYPPNAKAAAGVASDDPKPPLRAVTPATAVAGAPAKALGFVGELNQRFLAAMTEIRNSPLEDWDESGLIGLHYLEQDFGVQVNAAELTQKALEMGIDMPRLIRKAPSGLAATKLLEEKVDLKWLRRNVNKKVPFQPSEVLLLLSLAQTMVSNCLPSEQNYNARLLRHVNAISRPPETEWLLYGMHAGMMMHACIGPEFALQNTQHLVAPLAEWLKKPGLSAGVKAYVLFAIAVSGRLSAMPSEVVIQFVRTQRPDGSWPSEKLDIHFQNQTPLGAYVIATMLRDGGHPLPQTDFRYATLLPAQKQPLVSSNGGKL